MTPLRTRARDAIRDAWAARRRGGRPPRDRAGRRRCRRSRSSARRTRTTATSPRASRSSSRDRTAARRSRSRRPSRPSCVPRDAALFASVDVARAGLRQPALRRRAARGARRARSSAAPAAWGRVRAAQPERIDVEFVSANPTGPLHIGNARGAFVGDLLSRVLEAAGHEPTREYYFNDFGAQVRNLGASVVAIRAGARGPRGRLPRRLRPRPRSRPLPPELADEADRDPEAADVDRRPLGVRAGPHRHRGQPRSPRRPFRRLEDGELAPHRGLGRPRGRSAARSRLRLRGGRRDLVPLDRVRRRQGPRHPQVQRRRDLLRGRPRLRHREVQPRLRPPDLHLGRRPPRDGRAAPERGRGDGLRPDGRRGDAHGVGALRARRRRGLDEQARRRLHHARRAACRDRRRRGPLVLRLARAVDRHRFRHRAGQAPVERQPGLLRPVRARPDRIDRAQGRRGGLRASAARPRLAGRGAGGGARARPRPASRRWSRTQRSPARPRA